jgi:hypothetical protein
VPSIEPHHPCPLNFRVLTIPGPSTSVCSPSLAPHLPCVHHPWPPIILWQERALDVVQREEDAAEEAEAQRIAKGARVAIAETVLRAVLPREIRQYVREAMAEYDAAIELYEETVPETLIEPHQPWPQPPRSSALAPDGALDTGARDAA